MAKFLILISFIFFGFGFTTTERTNDFPIIKLKNNIVISPNPAVSVAKVFSNKSMVRIKRVEVYSMLNERKITLTAKIPVPYMEMNVFKLDNGKYFVKVYLSDGSEELATLIKID